MADDRHRGARRPHHESVDHDLPVDPDQGPAADSPGRRYEASVLLAIALGGALGAPARYGVAQLVHVAPDTFPWATFWTNVSGSFALGVAMALLVHRLTPGRHARPFVAVGFLGAYTTYSTFAVETGLLVKDGHALTAAVYAVASLVGGGVAVWAGLGAARVVPLPGRGAKQ
jgi:CrcB protein